MSRNLMQFKIDSLQIARYTERIKFVWHEIPCNPKQNKIDSLQIARYTEQISFDSDQMPCNPMQNKIDSLQIARHTKRIQFVWHEISCNPEWNKIDSSRIAHHTKRIRMASIRRLWIIRGEEMVWDEVTCHLTPYSMATDRSLLSGGSARRFSDGCSP